MLVWSNHYRATIHCGRFKERNSSGNVCIDRRIGKFGSLRIGVDLWQSIITRIFARPFLLLRGIGKSTILGCMFRICTEFIVFHCECPLEWCVSRSRHKRAVEKCTAVMHLPSMRSACQPSNAVCLSTWQCNLNRPSAWSVEGDMDGVGSLALILM